MTHYTQYQPAPGQFVIRADQFRAAYQAVSKEETRYYLCGVLLDTAAQLVGCDGHMILHIDPAAGAWTHADNGKMILQTDITDKAFKPRITATGFNAWLYGDATSNIIQVLSVSGQPGAGEKYERVGLIEFAVVDGTFPDWEQCNPVSDKIKPDPEFAFNPALVKRMHDAHKCISSTKEPHMRFKNIQNGSALNVSFAGNPEMHGLLMPCRWHGD